MRSWDRLNPTAISVTDPAGVGEPSSQATSCDGRRRIYERELGTVTPDVDIDGPDTIPPGIECHWEARGEWLPPVTFAWTGLATGNDEELWASAYSSDYLQIVVTDFQGRQGYDLIDVTVDEEMEDIPEGCEA